jgi:hypothetical protein
MKTIILSLSFFFFNYSFLYSQTSSNIKAYLDDAISAIEKEDHTEYLNNMRILYAAFDKEEITPENIPKEYFDQYTKAISKAGEENVQFGDEFASRAIVFLKAKIKRDSLPEDMFTLGYMHDVGSTSIRNYEIAKKWYQKAAQKGHEFAMNNLGSLYKENKIGNKDESSNYKKAYYWYTRAIDSGSLVAMNNLAILYEVGKIGRRNDKPNYKKAKYWYKKAAKEGYKNAILNLAQFYYDVEKVKRKPNFKKAKYWFEELRKVNEEDSKKGSLVCMNNLGVMYYKGMIGNFDGKFDYDSAKYWFEKAALKGYTRSEYHLGVLYDLGKGVNEDPQKAMSWYKKAALKGYAPAQTEIAVLYMLGRGVEINYREAIKWLKKAADYGYARAQNNLGSIYEKGEGGIPQNYIEAIKWFEKAASQGNSNAQYNLAYMYEFARGTDKNYEKASYWYQKACNNGNRLACSALEYLNDKKD